MNPLANILLENAFYRNIQDDSDEFLRRLLEGQFGINEGSPALIKAMQGHQIQLLQCTREACRGQIQSVEQAF